MIGMLTTPVSVSTPHARSARRGSSIAWRNAITASLARVRLVIIERERGAAWIGELAEVRNA